MRVIQDVMIESRPNNVMNHGAPAATTAILGIAGSKIRSAPRSRIERARARFTESSPVVISGVDRSHFRSRVAGVEYSTRSPQR